MTEEKTVTGRKYAASDDRSREMAELIQLRGQLRERDDMVKLGKAVRTAEAMQDAGELPDEMLPVVSEARKEYDRIRKEGGELRGLARHGDLRVTKEAADGIESLIYGGRKFIDDTVVGQRDIAEALLEARRYWEDRSKEVAAHEIDKARRFLPEQPRLALSTLRRALYDEVPDEDDPTKKYQVAVPHHEEGLKMLHQEIWRLEQLVAASEQAQGSNDPGEQLKTADIDDLGGK